MSPSLGCWLLVFIFPSSDKVFGVIWVTLNARCGFRGGLVLPVCGTVVCSVEASHGKV